MQRLRSAFRSALVWLKSPLTPRWSWQPSPRRRPLRGKDLVFLFAPVMLLGGYVLIGAAVDFRNIRQYDDWWSNSVHLPELVLGRLRLAANAPKAATLEQTIGPEAADAAIIRLHVPRDSWQQLVSDQQGHWGVWLDGELERDKTLHKVKLRRRGDTSVHWTTDKLTFTFKMDDNELLKGFPSLIFSSKDVLPQYVAANLAQDFHLLSPSVFVAPVFLNNRYYGVYRVIEPVDESFIRRVGHMPGNVFRGDGAERGDVFRGVPRGVFMNPYIWDFTAENTRPAAPDSSALISFLTALNGSTFDDHLRMMGWVERDEVARLCALMLLVGDLYHMDNVHNQLWYEDPWSGLLHPIPWDIRLLDLARPPARVNRFLTAAFRDPFLVDEILREIYPRIQDDSITRAAERLARGAHNRFRNHFEYDRLRGGMVADVGTPEEVIRVMRGNTRLLRTWLEDARVAFHSAPDGRGGLVLDFETRGFTGADLLAIDLTGATARGRIVADQNRNGVLDAGDLELPATWQNTPTGQRAVLAQPSALLAGWDTHEKGIRPGAVHYRFFVSATASSVQPELRNRLTQQPVTVLSLTAGAPRTPTKSWSPWQYPKVRGKTTRWAGVVHLSKTTRIAEADTLVIEAGTRVRLDPEVSLIVRGHIKALGSASAPIVIEPASATAPWGTFALQGAGANGSRLDHVRFVRGGGSVVDRIEYSGMVSVHYARDVVFRNAAFIQNVRSDDSFHAMHARVDLLQCHFSDSNGDAVDYDYSDGLIEGCTFEGSRNDALDLMTSTPTIIGNVMRGSGDKGISIGEDSHPLVFNNVITECNRGIEVKDRSAPLLVNNQITGNGVGIFAQRKNWRYGSGGWPRLVNTVVDGNRVNFELDGFSRLTRGAATPMLSTAATTSSANSLDWVYAQHGLAPATSTNGPVAIWRRVNPIGPITSARFEDDFASVADGWLPTGGVTLLEKRRQTLMVGLEKRRGAITQKVDWNLDRGATLVTELAARDVDSLVVIARSDRGEVVRSLSAGGDIAAFQYVTMDLPPARYHSIEIAASPKQDLRRIDRQSGFIDVRAARIELASWALFKLPPPGLQTPPARVAARAPVQPAGAR